MEILFLESFYGGSHRDFARDFCDFSSHGITLLTLPARHWKWRQAGSALAFLDQMEEKKLAFSDFDGVIVTGLIDLNLLKSLASLPPVLLYLHETQFHYPLGPGEPVDYHYGLKDFTNMLAADKIIFNSCYHGNTFFKEARHFLTRMPDGKPQLRLEKIQKEWDVIYPGFRERKLGHGVRESINPLPLILWNHRWEHDKNPEAFYLFLKGLERIKRPFKLILLGERYKKYPPVFDRIIEDFNLQIIINAYVESRDDYERYLNRADFVISTSVQENFGIAMVEAIRAGCLPILPDRLSYGELLGNKFKDYLYTGEQGMIDLFVRLSDSPPPKEIRADLVDSMKRFDRQEQIDKMDEIIEHMIMRTE